MHNQTLIWDGSHKVINFRGSQDTLKLNCMDQRMTNEVRHLKLISGDLISAHIILGLSQHQCQDAANWPG
eukprot:10098912-Prorocentrum_lima.AAC.1